MKTLVVYDTQFGNTEKIARAIGESLCGEAITIRAGGPGSENLKGVNLLIVGSPTQGGRPTKAVQDFLGSISEVDIRGLKIAAFDTRFSSRLAKVFGYAADRIAQQLTEKGGTLAISPEGFFVKAKKGPLKEGEPERAAAWAKKASEQCCSSKID